MIPDDDDDENGKPKRTKAAAASVFDEGGMIGLAERMGAAPGAFMRWWLGELGSFLPSWLKAGTEGARSRLVLEVGLQDIVLKAVTPKGEETLGRMAGVHAADDVAGLPGLHERRYRRWPLVVRLAADLGMRRIVDLPLAARADLGSLLRFELDRLTPFRADEVRLAWRILDTDQATGRMNVLLEMAPQTLIDRATTLAADHGRPVDRVEIEAADGRQPLDLRPATGTPQGERSRFRRLLPPLVLVLALVAAWMPFDRQGRSIARLESEIAAVKGPAEESLALRDRLDSRLSRAGFLTRAKNEHVSMTRLLAELTELLPDQSHLLQLDVDGGSVRLQGLADKASDLITIFERSPLFTSPQFRSPVIRDPGTGKERFQIALEIGGPTS